jgi:hypothetical protein
LCGVAIPQQAVPPPPKPVDEGPSLEATMKFIQDKVNSNGPINYVVYMHDEITGQESTPRQDKDERSKAVANPNSCVVTYQVKLETNGQVAMDKDSAVPLKRVEKIIVVPLEQWFKTSSADSGHP